MFANIWNHFQDTDFPTQVNIVLSVLSFLSLLFSLVFVIITIYQNQKILKQNAETIQLSNDSLKQTAETIENSTRPYITIVFESTHLGTPLGYFMVKNYGFSPGTITECQYSDSIKNCTASIADVKALFDCLIGTTLAPNQKYLIPFKLADFKEDSATFDITYIGTSNGKIYSERVKIVVSNYAGYIKPRACNDKKLEKDISYALQEIAERLM